MWLSLAGLGFTVSDSLSNLNINRLDMNNPKIGFIGQGWIGKNYADSFEERGFEIVRYGLEPEYIGNASAISGCDIVFIAVPTPTTLSGFDMSAVSESLKSVGKGKIAVIKSTIVAGSTKRLQAENPDVIVLHSPEFLREKHAAHDARNPDRNIIGFADSKGELASQKVLDILPSAPFNKIVPSEVAELVKYGGNCFLYLKVLFMNIMHDLSEAAGADYEQVAECIGHDPRIGRSHTEVVHDGGRGAGGACFVKDFAAFRRMLESMNCHAGGCGLAEAAEDYNRQLLSESGKSVELIKSVYGEE